MRFAGVVCLLAAACAPIGGIDDGTSLSWGGSSGGYLKNAVKLPVRGDGYVIPTAWSSRGLNWGTEELVGLIVRAARMVDREAPGSRLFVADLSPRIGGTSAWHRSHQSGRDADLHFFALDALGRPAQPPLGMRAFGPDGKTPAFDLTGKPLLQLSFDVPRNWILVRALLDDPAADVQFLFIYEPLKQLLLEHARAIGEPEEVIVRADALLHQPGDSLPHDDHLHVRIFCPRSDRVLGCQDRGPLRWFKKSYKYLQARGLSIPAAARACLLGPFCTFTTRRNLAWL